VAIDAQGAGLGAHLLLDATVRSLRGEVACADFIVNAEDDGARASYFKYSFRAHRDDPDHLFLARKTIEPLLRRDPSG